jgi:hypothetical protein
MVNSVPWWLLIIKKPSTIKTVDGFGELLGLASRLTVCSFQKGGALSSETTEPES